MEFMSFPVSDGFLGAQIQVLSHSTSRKMRNIISKVSKAPNMTSGQPFIVFQKAIYKISAYGEGNMDQEWIGLFICNASVESFDRLIEWE